MGHNAANETELSSHGVHDQIRKSSVHEIAGNLTDLCHTCYCTFLITTIKYDTVF